MYGKGVEISQGFPQTVVNELGLEEWVEIHQVFGLVENIYRAWEEKGNCPEESKH